MNDYVDNVRRVSSQQIVYSTKKMYLPQSFKLPVKWIVLVVLLPFILIAVLAFLLIYGSIDKSLLVYSVFGLPFLLLVVWVVVAIFQGGKPVDVSLLFDRPHNEVLVYVGGHKARKISKPQSMRVIVRYHRLYSSRSYRKSRIIMLSVELISALTAADGQVVQYLPIANIQCSTRKEAMDSMAGVVTNYQFISEWLQVPISCDTQHVFIGESEKKEVWYLLMS